MASLLECKLGIYEKALPSYFSWEERLSEAARLGYDFLEISIDETDEKIKRLQWSSSQKEEVVRAMDQTGVRILTMCLSANRKYTIGSEDASAREKGIRLIKDAIRFSVDLGIRIVQLASYDEYYGERNGKTERLFLEGLTEVTAFAAMHAVTLAFETMDTDFIRSIRQAMKYVDILRSPWLQVYPDIGNMTAAGMTPKDIREDFIYGAGHLTAIHLKDTKPGMIRRIPFGEGTVDFVEFFRLLERMRYSGLFVAEMWTDDDQEYASYVSNAHRFLKENMERALKHL